MTPRQKEIVQETWAQVVPIADQAAALFYHRLFEVDPTLRPLFDAVDMPAQQTKLTAFLGGAVSSLDQLDAVLPTVEALGQRHIAYGVVDRHYDSVGAALLWTLEQGLGDGWTEEAETAWTAAYTVLSNAMRGGANAPA